LLPVCAAGSWARAVERGPRGNRELARRRAAAGVVLPLPRGHLGNLRRLLSGGDGDRSTHDSLSHGRGSAAGTSWRVSCDL